MRFLCSSMTGVEAARMTAMGGGQEIFEGASLELIIILISFQNVSLALFRCEHKGQERRIHLTELNHVLNTVSASGTLIVSEWHLDSTHNSPLSCFPPHSTPYL